MTGINKLHSSTSSMTVREAAFNVFRSFGVNKIFGNPGSTELPMFREFPCDFEYILGLQESVVIGMADGYAQATRRPALVNLHSAAGVGHGMGNIFTAFKNQTPLVVTAGQQARSMLPYEPYLFADQAVAFPKPYVKWSVEPARAQDVPNALARAFHTALQSPCGPVFVSIPVDDWDQICEPVEIRKVSRSIRANEEMLKELERELENAKRPAFVVGAELARDDAWDDMILLAEKHNANVWASPMSGRNSFPENHRLFAGFLPASREGIVKKLESHDVVVVLGAPVFTYHVEGQGVFVPKNAKLYQLTCDPSQAAWAPTGMAIITSLKAGVKDLLSGSKLKVNRPAPSNRTQFSILNNDRLTSELLCQSISQLRPNDSIIVEEAPTTREALHDYLPINNKDGFYTCASGGLGHGLPAAIGVAMGRKEEKVIALLGDGSSMYAIQGLWTAAQHKLPISFIIANNGHYSALDSFGKHFGIEKVPGTKLPEIDFSSIAKGHGVPARKVDQCADLNEALKWSFKDIGPTLIDVRIE